MELVWVSQYLELLRYLLMSFCNLLLSHSVQPTPSVTQIFDFIYKTNELTTLDICMIILPVR